MWCNFFFSLGAPILYLYAREFTFFTFLYYFIVKMEHSIESHTLCVNELCRICGNLCCVTKKQKKNNNRAHKCALIATDMFLIYGIDVNQEQEDTYSISICGKCFTKMRDIKRTNSNTVLTRAQEIFNTMYKQKQMVLV